MALGRYMYFGNRERMTLVRAPQIDYDAPKVGWSGGVTQFLSGLARNRRSTTNHAQYNFTWTNMARDEIRAISDYAEGVYGPGTLYFLDPMAMDKNLLPQYWATPRLVQQDGPVLTGSTRQDFIMYPSLLSNNLSYPVTAPQYTYSSTTWPASASRPTIYIPLPAGYTLWFGAHGVVSAAGSNPLTVTPDGGSQTAMPILDVTNSTRFSNSWDSNGVGGVTIGFQGNTGSAVVSGMMVQVLPTGVVPATGGFISGQGNSGVSFQDAPMLHPYSAALDKMSLTAVLVEA